MSSGPDLFVVCKHCQAEVSPYITECPYCGKRLRKRAQLDRPQRRERVRRAAPTLSLGRLRPDEIPGIRPDRRPYGTMAIIAVSAVLALLPAAGVFIADRGVVVGPIGSQWWRLLTSNFLGYGGLTIPFGSSVYAMSVMVLVALFGTGLERRHGLVTPVVIFLLGGAAGMAVVAGVEPSPLAAGGNAGALALLCAWAIPDLLERRAGRPGEADGAGLLALFGLIMLMPLVTDVADPLAAVTGASVGLLIGLVLARLRPTA